MVETQKDTQVKKQIFRKVLHCIAFDFKRLKDKKWIITLFP